MRFVTRPYLGASDQQAMLDLARSNPQAPPHVVDLPYRFCSWAFEDPENVSLWFDGEGRLQAWAVLQPPFWTVDYALNPNSDQVIFPHILAWADKRARSLHNTIYDRPVWYVEVFSEQVEHISILEAAGFQSQADIGEDSWKKVLFRRPGRTPVREFRLPTGFTVRPLAGEAEIVSYVELHRAVFETKNMTMEWRRRTLQHPDHSPDLDLVAVAPDGRLAAFCIGWLWSLPGKAPVGQIEPLGCGQEFRRYALGRTVLAEVLRRMEGLGVENIYVETDNYRNTAMDLYKSMGFQVEKEIKEMVSK